MKYIIPLYILHFTFYYMDLSSIKQQMQKTIDFLNGELKTIQVWRATTTMLDSVVVKASYGEMKISWVAHVSVLDSLTLKVEPRDKKEWKHIASAVYDADLGLTAINEGDYVMVKVPELTKERREEIAKKVKSMWEDVKARLRVIRQDGQKESKKLLTDKKISEDEHKNNEIDIDNLTKEMNELVEKLIKEKTEDVMKMD